MIWLAYYLVVFPLLVMLLVPGDRAPRWLFWSVLVSAAAGTWLTFYLLAAGAS